MNKSFGIINTHDTSMSWRMLEFPNTSDLPLGNQSSYHKNCFTKYPALRLLHPTNLTWPSGELYITLCASLQYHFILFRISSGSSKLVAVRRNKNSLSVPLSAWSACMYVFVFNSPFDCFADDLYARFLYTIPCHFKWCTYPSSVVLFASIFSGCHFIHYQNGLRQVLLSLVFFPPYLHIYKWHIIQKSVI